MIKKEKLTVIERKLLNLSVLLFILLFSSCDKDEDISKSFDAYPVTTFEGEEGNGKVMLNWESPEEGSPNLYLVRWAPGEGFGKT